MAKMNLQIVYISDHIQDKYRDSEGFIPVSVLETDKVERGFITSVKNEIQVFCRYWYPESVAHHELRTKANSELTYLRNLFLLEDTDYALPQEKITGVKEIKMDIRREVTDRLLMAGLVPEIIYSPDTMWRHPTGKCTVQVYYGGHINIWYHKHPVHYSWNSQTQSYFDLKGKGNNI